jgi:hypothetical protein
MLEQAIVDAAALREAALKNAEQSIIEKYAPQIKEAVEAMLENDSSNTKMYQGRTVSVIYESDEDGNVTVSENGGKPFVVNETELSEATEGDILQEEEAQAASDTTTPPPAEFEAPPAWDSRYPEDQQVTLSAFIDNMEDELEINLDDIELSMAEKEASEADDMNTAAVQPEEAPEEAEPEKEESLDDMFSDLEGADLKLQELLDILSEYDQEILDEDIEVDMGEMKLGSFVSNKSDREYETDKQKAHDAHQDDEDESEEEDDEKLQEALKETDQLQKAFLILKEQNEKLESVVNQLSKKLEETLLSNAKLLYQNRTVNDASLNERQKSKIVEAIANAESPKEAKSLHETLRATVGSKNKKGPQSLNETVNRRSNLSSMLNTRQNLNESKSDDPFMDKMQRLAGIKK